MAQNNFTGGGGVLLRKMRDPYFSLWVASRAIFHLLPAFATVNNVLILLDIKSSVYVRKAQKDWSNFNILLCSCINLLVPLSTLDRQKPSEMNLYVSVTETFATNRNTTQIHKKVINFCEIVG